MPTIHRFTGLGIILFVLVCSVQGAGDLWMFIDPIALVLVLGLVVGGLWMGCGPTRARHAFAVALGRAGDHDDAARVFAMGYQFSWGAGILGMLMSIITFLKNIDDPSKVGPALAVAMLPFLYAAIVAELIFNPLRHAMNNPPTVHNKPSPTPPTQHRWIATSVLLFMLLTFSFISASKREVAGWAGWYTIVHEVSDAFDGDLSQLSSDQRESVERVKSWHSYPD